jgi:lipopolysaccharide export system protein LptA
MARLRAKRHVQLAAITVIAVISALPVRAALPQLDANLPIQLEARSSDVDYKNNTLLFRTVRISQGALSVEADEATATGLDFNDSHWQFKGHVKITTKDGFLKADEARITFLTNQLSAADAYGAPANFEQRRADSVATGHAREIEYRPSSATIKLTKEASLSDGRNDISGNTLLYNLRDQRVIANPEDQSNERIRITIAPKPVDPKHP